jgi:hypothetical protein
MNAVLLESIYLHCAATLRGIPPEIFFLKQGIRQSKRSNSVLCGPAKSGHLCIGDTPRCCCANCRRRPRRCRSKAAEPSLRGRTGRRNARQSKQFELQCGSDSPTNAQHSVAYLLWRDGSALTESRWPGMPKAMPHSRLRGRRHGPKSITELRGGGVRLPGSQAAPKKSKPLDSADRMPFSCFINNRKCLPQALMTG